MLRLETGSGQDKTQLTLASQRISRLDKTVSKVSVADSLDLSPIQFTPRTPTRPDTTVLSCRCRRCELAIAVGRECDSPPTCTPIFYRHDTQLEKETDRSMHKILTTIDGKFADPQSRI